MMKTHALRKIKNEGFHYFNHEEGLLQHYIIRQRGCERLKAFLKQNVGNLHIGTFLLQLCLKRFNQLNSYVKNLFILFVRLIDYFIKNYEGLNTEWVIGYNSYVKNLFILFIRLWDYFIKNYEGLITNWIIGYNWGLKNTKSIWVLECDCNLWCIVHSIVELCDTLPWT